MCGIAGIYCFGEGTYPPEALNAMADSLEHRGPDEEGYYKGSSAGFAHRRLKIIDLRREAAQPMSDESGRYHLMFNGEIYNFRELRSELEGRYRFFSRSDTEVILRLFQEDGERTWDRLRGMFALAIYDAGSRELFLARDHAGIKPLYIYRDGGHLVFASEIKALFASGLVSGEIDESAIALYLAYGYFPGRSTPYRNIFKLLPGESARVNSAGVRFSRFWSIRNPVSPKSSEQSEAERLDGLLQKSVEGHMISDVPLGAFLSGGIDSSLLAALMCRISPQKVKTFTVGFPRMGYYDERPYAAKIAEHLGTEHHEYSVESGIADMLPQLATVFDEPFADSSAVPTLCLARLAREQVTVALSGTGGDEVFGGYRKYMAGYWMQWYAGLPATVRMAMQKTAAVLPGSRRGLWRERALLLQRFTGLDPQDRPEIQLNRLFSPAEAAQISQTAALAWEPAFEPVAGSASENLMLFDMEIYLPEDLLVKEDRCTMRFGLESRVPYLDRDIVEFMAALPVSHKVSATSTKRLFKKVASKYLPDWVIRRPKHGFGSPVAEWIRTDLRDATIDLLLGPSAHFKSELIEHKIQDHLAGRSDQSRQIWALLMLQLWIKKH